MQTFSQTLFHTIISHTPTLSHAYLEPRHLNSYIAHAHGMHTYHWSSPTLSSWSELSNMSPRYAKWNMARKPNIRFKHITPGCHCKDQNKEWNQDSLYDARHEKTDLKGLCRCHNDTDFSEFDSADIIDYILEKSVSCQ